MTTAPTPAEAAPATALRPLMAFDLDGVLARPPFGRNLTIRRDLTLTPGSPADGPVPGPGRSLSLQDRLLRATYYRARYWNRPPMRHAHAALIAATRDHRVIILTARNWRGRAMTEAWLRRHRLAHLVDALYCNDTGLPSPQFKRLMVERLGVVRHVDDDAATAALIARGGVPVDLIDWPRNRDLSYPEGVSRHADLEALAITLWREHLARPQRGPGGRRGRRGPGGQPAQEG